MKRIYSLKGRNLFREVLHRGRIAKDTGVRVHVLSLRMSRYGKPGGAEFDAAGKKIRIAINLSRTFGNAHIRNRAKRRIRAMCREMFDDMRDGVCIIIRIESDIKGLSYDREKHILRSLFMKAGIMTR